MSGYELEILDRKDNRKLIYFSINIIDKLKNYLDNHDINNSAIVYISGDVSPKWYYHYHEDNLDALIGLEIRNLMIRNGWRIKNLLGLYSLINLQELDAEGLEVPIDFIVFKKLKTLVYHWHKKTKNLFRCIELSNITIYNYNGEDLQEFSELINLKNLSLINTKIKSIKGIETLLGLKKIFIYNAPELVIKGEDETLMLRQVEDLEIEKCKNINLGFVNAFPNLKKLKLGKMGKLDTLRPLLAGLPFLEHLAVGDGTVISETDNRYYLDYHNIKEFFFEEKRHHLLKMKDLGKWD